MPVSSWFIDPHLHSLPTWQLLHSDGILRHNDVFFPSTADDSSHNQGSQEAAYNHPEIPFLLNLSFPCTGVSWTMTPISSPWIAGPGADNIVLTNKPVWCHYTGRKSRLDFVTCLCYVQLRKSQTLSDSVAPLQQIWRMSSGDLQKFPHGRFRVFFNTVKETTTRSLTCCGTPAFFQTPTNTIPASLFCFVYIVHIWNNVIFRPVKLEAHCHLRECVLRLALHAKALAGWRRKYSLGHYHFSQIKAL